MKRKQKSNFTDQPITTEDWQRILLIKWPPKIVPIITSLQKNNNQPIRPYFFYKMVKWINDYFEKDKLPFRLATTNSPKCRRPFGSPAPVQLFKIE